MKKNTITQFISIQLAVLCISGLVYGQNVGVKIDNVDATEDTTISIKKGDSATPKKKWTLTEGEEDVMGDKDVVMKNAEKNWKKACDEWKKEFKENNKNIVSMSCGKMNCTKEGVESTCVSKAQHKVKVLTEE